MGGTGAGARRASWQSAMYSGQSQAGHALEYPPTHWGTASSHHGAPHRETNGTSTWRERRPAGPRLETQALTQMGWEHSDPESLGPHAMDTRGMAGQNQQRVRKQVHETQTLQTHQHQPQTPPPQHPPQPQHNWETYHPNLTQTHPPAPAQPSRLPATDASAAPVHSHASPDPDPDTLAETQTAQQTAHAPQDPQAQK